MEDNRKGINRILNAFLVGFTTLLVITMVVVLKKELRLQQLEELIGLINVTIVILLGLIFCKIIVNKLD